MRVTKISARDIDEGLRRRWRTLQASNGALQNPYFAVEYTEAVASVRDDVYLGLVEDAGQTLAIFPFQVRRGGVAEPVGGRMSDYHGIIGSSDACIDIVDLMRGCDLKVWEFHHLLACQRDLWPYHRVADGSPVLDLGAGFDAYLGMPKVKKGNHLREIRRRSRKFERDVAPLRLVECSDDEEAFRTVVAWKSEQCRATGVPEFLKWKWTEGMLRRIWETASPDLTGMLSVLYAGDTIFSAHFGMWSESVLHWWFPVYNSDYRRYSPGGILLYRMAEWAAGKGIDQLDLGKGDEDYKRFFATGAVPLATGAVRVPSATSALHLVRHESERFIRESTHAEPLRNQTRRVREIARSRRSARPVDHALGS